MESSSWYLYAFDMGLVSSVEEIVEPGRKRQSYGAVLADGKLPKVPLILVEGEFLSLSEAKSKMRHFSGTRYLADNE